MNVSVVKVAPPVVTPPSTYTITLEGLSSMDVSAIRKVLENSSIAAAEKVGAAIKAQSGNTGEFYSGLRVERITDEEGEDFIRFVVK
jgi:hypothetical protein